MIVKVDVRESELINLISDSIKTIPAFKELQLIVENLPLGDIILNENEKDLVIIERKSIRDLAASIKDGRYEEQSYRLNGIDHHNHNILYLIEGQIDDPIRKNFGPNIFKNSIDKTTINSAITSLSLYKGFSVLRTFNIKETAQLVCSMANKIRKNTIDNKKFYYSQDYHSKKEETIVIPIIKVVTDDELEKTNKETLIELDQSEEKKYVNVVKKVKKENVTPQNIGEIMLSQIPGISAVTALALMTQFKTITNLNNEIQKDPKCLENITCVTAKGQTRKISKTCAVNIMKYLLNTNE